MDRKLNVVFSFVAVLVFMLDRGEPLFYWGIIGGLVLSFLFSLSAFLLRWLSLDGMFAATVAGTLIFGLGGWQMTVIVLLFFASSAVISGEEGTNTLPSSEGVRRNGMQVWANGFWLVVCITLYAVLDAEMFLIGGIAAIAVATADTWATELRSTGNNATYLITTYEPVRPGTDGGISLKGTMWASAGSLLIAVTAINVFSLQLGTFFIIFAAGFSGCLLDSYLGAFYQRPNRPIAVPLTQIRISIGNNLVNAISTAAGALLAIILVLMSI